MIHKKHVSSQSHSQRQGHPYHLVDPSPWPFCMSISVLVMALGLVMSFHKYMHGKGVMALGFSCVFYTMYVGGRDISRESLNDYHTEKVQYGLHAGMVIFILTEAMFFVGLLWSGLHAALTPTVQINQIGPPEGILTIDGASRPTLNSALLATSYFTANLCIYYLQFKHSMKLCKIFLGLTILLGVCFTFYQYLEYNDAQFTMSDSVYGSNFYLATGFHGFHVIVGFLFLTVCFLQLNVTTVENSIGIQLAVLYGHFVDIVGIALFTLIYMGGSVQDIRPSEFLTDPMSILDDLLDLEKGE